MKAMWDGFSLEFRSVIFVSLQATDFEEVAFPEFGKILDAAKNDRDGMHTAWIVNKDLDFIPFYDFKTDKGLYHLAEEHFRTRTFPRLLHVVPVPPIEKWNQRWDKGSCLFPYLRTIRTIGPDHPLEAESRWKFKRAGTGTQFRANIFGLPEDEGGAPIAAGDRLTFTDGPNDVEGTLSAYYGVRTVSPRSVTTIVVDLDKPSEYLAPERRFTVKQDGKLVALGILTD
ncbi:hypothetical protein N7532_011822 [Penicillium argentinense]|uniref:Uncharacterized protein n=1 Tax=Penicillium argentinense TaxID=1131581 RepID=A0A9W9EJB3_9EURO|nr:uncharacterized protein N7532_011822 [Penicillium argentinense]KAJ5082779.1 hypothetical protein N7532_011822 [Penicillium argentinense]